MENISWIRAACFARKFNLIILCAVVAFATERARGQTSYKAQVLYALIPPGGVSSIGTFQGLPPTLSGGSFNYNDGYTDSSSYYWSPLNGSVIDLTPTNLPGFTASVVGGLGNGQQVGGGALASGGSQALIWNGSANTAIDIGPANFTGSFVIATDGTNQVGDGYGESPPYGPGSQALLWTGTAASAVVLSADYVNTIADGVGGNEQVGYGFNGTQGSAYEVRHAMLWTGSAASAVDLSPSGLPFHFLDTYAFGTNGTQQVGYGDDDLEGLAFHALLWNGTAASAVDLNPTDIPGLPSYSVSSAHGTNGTEQVGFYAESSAAPFKAVAWFDTANSAIDLNALLPPDGSWAESEAFDVDANDNVFGTALGTYNGLEAYYAIEWIPVPEPDCLAMFTITSIGWIASCRCKRA